MTYTRSPVLVAGRPNTGLNSGASLGLFDEIVSVLFGVDLDPNDNVDQTASGGTSTSASDFTNIGGVCKPQNFPALAASRELQNQLNRVAQMKGFSKISSDGAIGPGTLTLFRQVQAIAAGSVMGDASACTGIAPDVDVLSVQVKAVADSLGAPATVSGPLFSNPPSILTKSGKTVVPPDAGVLGMLGQLSGVEKIAIVGLAGGIGYLLMTGAKKRRGKR
ncbi:MAG TPA: hypothetical protein VK601_31230 [Kofleriaceae bacterium]|jgi:hypothetical protein|nr:hypothetical protein [Kofleriaceae bacterium]